MTRQDIHKEIVREFRDCLGNRKDFGAARKYLAPTYIRHNPPSNEGIEAFEECAGACKKDPPDLTNEVIRVLADGDYVVLHVHSFEPPDIHVAVVEIYRFENGFIAEQWDVAQIIPATSSCPDRMF
ncbi:MAG TPA: ester cyclase [Syntrophorhabdaceae bacterium]|jgi:predicted SnoaL-like aldol condensation-catalyzing enzyme